MIQIQPVLLAVRTTLGASRGGGVYIQRLFRANILHHRDFPRQEVIRRLARLIAAEIDRLPKRTNVPRQSKNIGSLTWSQALAWSKHKPISA